jgi:hypothetical protein
MHLENFQVLTHGKQKWRFLGFINHFDWKKMYDFIWKFRLEAPPSPTMGTLWARRSPFQTSNLTNVK